MSDELVKNLRSTYYATTPRKINTISTGQTVVHTAAPTVVYRNPDGPAAADRIEAAEARVKVLEKALRHISLGSQNSSTTKEHLGREARQALRGEHER